MPLSETDIQGVLAKLVDPNTGKDYVATRSVKSVKAADGKVAVEIELGYPGKSQVEEIRRQVIDALKAAGAPGASVTVRSKVVSHAVQRGRKPYLDGFHIAHDNWHSTHSAENTERSQDIFRRLKKRGLIYTKPVEQFYDPVKGMYLADRYVKGECPNCGAKDQYGDACENCSTVYSATALKNPYSSLSGAKPELRTSEHYFFKLSDQGCVAFLREWLATPGRLQPQVLNKALEWIDGEGDKALGDWDISRDAPYFGIRVPDIAEEKYLYVWLDAPIGYLASLQNYCAKKGLDWQQVLAEREQVHFIGKDITYFHTLFWPAMLKFAGQNSVWK